MVGLELNESKKMLLEICIFLPPFFSADETRSALLDLCLKDVNLSTALDPKQISDKLNGFTGSDITNVCR